MPQLWQLVISLSPQRLRLSPTPVRVTFVVQKVTLGQLLSQYFSFICQYWSTSVPHLFIHLLPMLHYLSNLQCHCITQKNNKTRYIKTRVRQAHFQQQSKACFIYTLCKLLVSVTRNNTLNSCIGCQEDSGVLGCDAVSMGEWLLKFSMNTVLTFSRCKGVKDEELFSLNSLATHPMTELRIPQDPNLQSHQCKNLVLQSQDMLVQQTFMSEKQGHNLIQVRR